jgi:hypothetical protein
MNEAKNRKRAKLRKGEIEVADDLLYDIEQADPDPDDIVVDLTGEEVKVYPASELKNSKR